MKKILITILILLSHISLTAQIAATANEISPLLIGEKIPNTAVTLYNNKSLQTDAIFKKQKTILIMYRGGWCPYCTAQLKGLQEIEQDLISFGYQIVAVSPDTVTKAAAKYSDNYSLVSDSSTKLMQNLGIAFVSPSKFNKLLIKASNGQNKNILPVPAVYIVNTNGEIMFEYINPNYKNRINETLLVEAAKVLK